MKKCWKNFLWHIFFGHPYCSNHQNISSVAIARVVCCTSSNLRDTLKCGRKWLFEFNVSKNCTFFRWTNSTGIIDVKIDRSVLEEKLSFHILALFFFSKLDWVSYINSVAKTASTEIGTLIFSPKFLSSEVSLYLYKSTIWPCMEHYCHTWAGVPSGYLEIIDQLQKRICKTVVPSLAAFLKPLAHCRGVSSSSLLYRYYFGRC